MTVPPLTPMSTTSAHRALLAFSMFVFPALGRAQERVEIRNVTPTEAVSTERLGFVFGVHELSDGRVLVNDAGARRLLLFDRRLALARVIADSATGSPTPYGPRPTGLIPYVGDTAFLIDLTSRTFIAVEPDGRLGRVMTPPRLNDVGYMWNPGLGGAVIDPQGRLVYRSWLLPSVRPPEPGKPFVAPEIPDSAPVLRGDFDRRRADTVAWVRIPRMRRTVTPLENGAVTIRAMVNPVAYIDDWTTLPDGTIAILRGHDYHLDWIAPDGSRRATPKLPFDWKRLTDDEKRAIVDSTKAQIARQFAQGAMGQSGAASASAGLAAAAQSGGMVTGHSMTVMAVPQGGSGPASRASAAPAPAAPVMPEVVPWSDLPDYVPPVARAGQLRADRAGNVWILPSTTAQGTAGLLYDIVDREGALRYRVRLPEGRALVGFGADGAVYLTLHEGGTTRLERVRLAN